MKWNARSLTLFVSLVLYACDSVTDPPELIQKYAEQWVVQTRESAPFPLNLDYSSSLRLLPDGNILVSTSKNSGDQYRTTFLKFTPEGLLLKEAQFSGYSAYPRILADGTILSLSDSVRKFTSGLEQITVSGKPFDRFGLMAYDGQSMIYTDYSVNSTALSAYDYNGNQLWSKPARSLGCGGSIMLIESLAPSAGMYTRSFGQNTDTLRFSVFTLSNGKPVWSKTYLSSSFFGSTDADALNRIGISSLFWRPAAESVWVFAADATAEKIYIRSVGRNGIGRKVMSDLSAYPFGGLHKGLTTIDGGFLFGLNGNLTTDAYAYRLAKSDSRGNIGWVGTFTTLGNDFLVDMLELEDGTVIVMTGQGTVTAYRPQY